MFCIILALTSFGMSFLNIDQLLKNFSLVDVVSWAVYFNVMNSVVQI